MALKRVTMQQIADACGLSRNTVSKVFNGRGNVPDSTKKLVISTAQELGYYRYSAEEDTQSGAGANIALLTQHKLLSHNFGAYFITSFSDQISRAGYTMQMYEVTPDELAALTLPPLFDREQVAGVLGIELFDRKYIEMVCSLGIPTVFVDGFARAGESLLHCDIVSMENISSEATIVRHAISNGARRLGFVGDIEHCNSFYERWLGFCMALDEAGIPYERDLCILERDGIWYGDTEWLLDQLAGLPTMPDAFVCANDFLAIRLLIALNRRGLSVPQDIKLLGFGGTPEAAVIEPALTTAQIPSSDIGILAAGILARRIQGPDFPFTMTYMKTTPILGGSTG